MLKEALAADGVSVITCPVDDTENLRLTDALGELSGPFGERGGAAERGWLGSLPRLPG